MTGWVTPNDLSGPPGGGIGVHRDTVIRALDLRPRYGSGKGLPWRSRFLHRADRGELFVIVLAVVVSIATGQPIRIDLNRN